MKKSNTDTCCLTLPLKLEKWQEDRLAKRFELARQLYNTLVHAELKRLAQVKQTAEYRENAAAPAAQRVAAVKGGSMTANGDVDLTLTADVTTTNGLLEITWDPSLMDYVSGVSTAQLSSFQPAEGKLLFGYAAEKEIASDAVLANLTFRPKDDVHCDLEVQVKTLQRNAESGLDLRRS